MTEQQSDTVIRAYAAIPENRKYSELGFPALDCRIESTHLTCLVGPHRFQLRAYLQMLAGIRNPVQGKVEIYGKEVSTLQQVAWQQLRSDIGYLSGISPLLSVQHGLMNVMLPALYHKNLSFREVADMARALLKKLDCGFEPTLFPAMLNSLQRAQLGLARALIMDPSILFLDVPFHDLGAKEREKMGVLLGDNRHNRAICMIGGFQYIHFLEQHADQIIFISEHKIIIYDHWDSFIHSEDQDVKDLLTALHGAV